MRGVLAFWRGLDWSGLSVTKASSALMKAGAILWALGNGAQKYSEKDYGEAGKMFIAALAVAGISLKLHETGKMAEAAAVVSGAAAINAAEANAAVVGVARDVENIRNNPAMPGTPRSDECP